LGLLLFYLPLEAKPITDSVLIAGRRLTLRSEILGEERAVWVHLPDSYKEGSPSQEKYPVIYVLDADLNFLISIGVQAALFRGGRSKAPNAILIGIENTDRTRDLTPTPAVSSKGQATLANSGGGEKFTSFLARELIPMIEQRFRVNERCMLIGHSFGGLTVLNIFLKHTELFSDYLAIDPSLWWDNSKLLKEAERLINQRKYPNVNIFIANAGKSKDRALEREGILPLPKLFDKLKPSGLQWKYRRFEEENHGSVVLPSLFYGLRFLYQCNEKPD